MKLNITTLPYEVLSTILDHTAQLNARESIRFTYGLSQAPEPAQDIRIQRVIRGNVAPDTQRWNSVDAIRQVNRQWHDWAVGYAVRDLYIRRWRGSERWMQSRTLHTAHQNPSSVVVYRDPFQSLRATFELFSTYPAFASHVRRLWLDGYYSAETDAMIFPILSLCTNLRFVSLPWTSLRHGTVEDWSNLLGPNLLGHSIESLEVLAVDIKQSQVDREANRNNKKPLESAEVNFNSLRRLKVQGQSNFSPVTDTDLITIARTATRLREIHITGTVSVSNSGIGALAEASQETLEILEHSPPLAAAGSPEHRDLSSLLRAPQQQQQHICPRILACPKLRNLSLSLPFVCPRLFTNKTVKWEGQVEIRASSICGHDTHALKTSPHAQDALWQSLTSARTLITSKQQEQNVELDIEIHINDWIFEPRRARVHGDFAFAKVLSGGAWPVQEEKSGKGPYEQHGLFGGKEGEGDWTVVGEESFREGLRRGVVSF